MEASKKTLRQAQGPKHDTFKSKAYYKLSDQQLLVSLIIITVVPFSEFSSVITDFRQGLADLRESAADLRDGLADLRRRIEELYLK